MSPTVTTVTVVRYYLDGGVPKTESVLWQWVPPVEGTDPSMDFDQGLSARARPLPDPVDPGLVPNLWVWTAANDAAVVIPRPDETVRDVRTDVLGEVVDTVEHHHHDGSRYWTYYGLPLRPGVVIVEESEWRAVVDAAAAQAEADKAERAAAAVAFAETREAHRASARAKLARLGLTDDEITAIVGR